MWLRKLRLTTEMFLKIPQIELSSVHAWEISTYYWVSHSLGCSHCHGGGSSSARTVFLQTSQHPVCRAPSVPGKSFANFSTCFCGYNWTSAAHFPGKLKLDFLKAKVENIINDIFLMQCPKSIKPVWVYFNTIFNFIFLQYSSKTYLSIYWCVKAMIFC